MFYTRLEYLIPPVCEEGQQQNKVIVRDLRLKLLHIGRHVFDLSMSERTNSILIVILRVYSGELLSVWE